MFTENDIIKQKILEMLIEDPSMILVLKNKYVSDDLWLFAIEREPDLFKEKEKPSLEICLAAVEADGANLKIIKKKHKHIAITRKLAYTAISNCPRAILDVPSSILDDGLKERAFDLDPSLMLEFDRIRPLYIKRKIKENPSVIKYVKNPDEQLICETILEDPNVCLYFEHFTPKMKSIIESKFPYLIDYLPIFNNES